MLLRLKNVLTREELATARSLLESGAQWVDGRSSAGGQAVARKNNEQLAQDSDASRRLQALVLNAVQRDPLFFSAALPRKIFNPLFNRYSGASNHYGAHIDGAVLHSRNPSQWVRTDISCTLFLAEPDEYDGGELVIQDPQGEQRIKLPAGDLMLYPGTTLHQVTPVTRGARLASFFWVESMVRGGEQRRLLFEMDMALLKLRNALGEQEPSVVQLTGTYHNLLRMWADT
ncbi:Fe2+-dependent dioxygenase [Noviherbaspirillum cavernae]|uniref:Fe2+-dependent dioxygenase n=1 Tax=Noviherbaspirillum cavernae TaxID=2320862 RepID=A0A418X2D7_9BURK|nr:Fe2+-dependent dioxygenase [Noviherbaspirillum cavernae]RJG06629.1 Fe2+-dependent dioxygenase [Noviherbaspirillum cavernae]